MFQAKENVGEGPQAETAWPLEASWRPGSGGGRGRQRKVRMVIRSQSPQEAMGHRKDCGFPPAGRGKSPRGYDRGVRWQPATFMHGTVSRRLQFLTTWTSPWVCSRQRETERPQFCLILLLGSKSLSPVHTQQEGTEYTRDEYQDWGHWRQPRAKRQRGGTENRSRGSCSDPGKSCRYVSTWQMAATDETPTGSRYSLSMEPPGLPAWSHVRCKNKKRGRSHPSLLA